VSDSRMDDVFCVIVIPFFFCTFLPPPEIYTLSLHDALPICHPSIWVIALAAGMVVGVGLGAIQGFLIAYAGIPAFIVTLGGLLVWRGAAWWVTSGRTVAPMDTTFRLMGGGPAGAIGETWSWGVAD